MSTLNPTKEKENARPSSNPASTKPVKAATKTDPELARKQEERRLKLEQFRKEREQMKSRNIEWVLKNRADFLSGPRLDAFPRDSMSRVQSQKTRGPSYNQADINNVKLNFLFSVRTNGLLDCETGCQNPAFQTNFHHNRTPETGTWKTARLIQINRSPVKHRLYLHDSGKTGRSSLNTKITFSLQPTFVGCSHRRSRPFFGSFFF
jgi:hypothetical protein